MLYKIMIRTLVKKAKPIAQKLTPNNACSERYKCTTNRLTISMLCLTGIIIRVAR